MNKRKTGAKQVKLWSAVLAMMLLIGLLAGCGGGSANQGDGGNVGGSQAAEGGNPVMAAAR